MLNSNYGKYGNNTNLGPIGQLLDVGLNGGPRRARGAQHLVPVPYLDNVVEVEGVEDHVDHLPVITMLGLSATPLGLSLSIGAAGVAAGLSYYAYEKHMEDARITRRVTIQKRRVIDLKSDIDTRSAVRSIMAATCALMKQGRMYTSGREDFCDVARQQVKILRKLCPKMSPMGNTTIFTTHPTKIDSERKYVTALGFVTMAFLQLPASNMYPGYFSHVEAKTLTEAIKSLSEHPYFIDYAWKDDEAKRSSHAQLAILLVLLQWQCVDPLAYSGYSGYFGASTFRTFCHKMCSLIRKANANDEDTHLRLQHFMETTIEAPPKILATVWTDAPSDASIVVRNWSPQTLNVRLFRKGEMPIGGLQDLPLIGFLFNPEPVLECTIDGRKEWAMRPKIREGRTFDMQLLSKKNKVVGENRIQRGMIYDFDVECPLKPKKLGKRDVGEELNKRADSFHKTLSTVASSEDHDNQNRWRTQQLPNSPDFSSDAKIGPIPSSNQIKLAEGKEKQSNKKEVGKEGYLQTAVCPQCWNLMAALWEVPKFTEYSEGVDCDRCEKEHLERLVIQKKNKEPYYHCEDCMYDMCAKCAWEEMQESWWRGESKLKYSDIQKGLKHTGGKALPGPQSPLTSDAPAFETDDFLCNTSGSSPTFKAASPSWRPKGIEEPLNITEFIASQSSAPTSPNEKDKSKGKQQQANRSHRNSAKTKLSSEDEKAIAGIRSPSKEGKKNDTLLKEIKQKEELEKLGPEPKSVPAANRNERKRRGGKGLR